MKVLKIISLSMLILCSALAAPNAVQAQDKSSTSPDIILGVDGMSCPFCAFGIEKKLNKLDQIQKLDVKLEVGFVDIYLKENQPLAESDLRKAVKKAGFSVRSIEYVNPDAEKKTGE